MEKIKPKNISAGRLMSRRCLYVGSRNFLLPPNGDFQEVESGKTGWAPIMIIGRESYFETVKDFPMNNAGEVRAAVSMDLVAHCPFAASMVLVKKIASREGGSTFNLWFLKPQITEQIEAVSPWFIIPETALPACLPAAAEILYRFPRAGDDGRLLLRVNGRGESRSLRLPAAADCDNFNRSLGTHPDAASKTFTNFPDYLAFLHATLAGCRLPQLLPFFNRGFLTSEKVKKPLLRCTAAAVFIFCLYLGLAFFIPFSAEKGLKRENQALNSKLSGLLLQRRQLDSLHHRQQQLADTVNNYTSKIALFQLLARSLPPRTVIRQLNMSGNTVEISGLSPQASQLLSSLSQKPEVSEARFSSPLREDRQSGREKFALMFRFSRKVK
ncbi:MAG: hypothetical protein BZ151_07470 [Desulfobacca sp. 4484_104]|nr:MAG: hypothetical protein BZ151_07470 [Desulfobacca sp. 4484_104]RLB72167.1 MAG: hypothetical protein DRH04_00075 [Deltaproteobacteria bacterium]